MKQLAPMLGVVVIAVLVAGCGGGLSTEEYFARTQAVATTIDEAATAAIADLTATLEDAQADEAARVEAFRALYRSASEALAGGAAELEAIEAPEAFAALHATLVAEVRAMADDFGAGLERLNEAESIREVVAALEGSAPDSPRFEAACAALEAAGREAGQEVDLRCRSLATEETVTTLTSGGAEEYFATAETIALAITTGLEAGNTAWETLQRNEPDAAELGEGLLTLFATASEVLSAGLVALDTLAPPAAYEALHAATLAELRVMRDEFQATAERLAEADSLEEMIAIAGEGRTEFPAFIAACEALQQAGREAGLDVNLFCR